MFSKQRRDMWVRPRSGSARDSPPPLGGFLRPPRVWLPSSRSPQETGLKPTASIPFSAQRFDHECRDVGFPNLGIRSCYEKIHRRRELAGRMRVKPVVMGGASFYLRPDRRNLIYFWQVTRCPYCLTQIQMEAPECPACRLTFPRTTALVGRVTTATHGGGGYHRAVEKIHSEEDSTNRS